MEFRQVRHKANLWNGDWYVFFITQQKWSVQDGEPYQGDFLPANMFDGPHKHVQIRPSCWVRTKEEWRDLPIVDAKDVT